MRKRERATADQVKKPIEETEQVTPDVQDAIDGVKPLPQRDVKDRLSLNNGMTVTGI